MNSPLQRFRSATGSRLGIDSRALAAFRICLGLLLLSDLALRSRSIGAFYTDAGVLPRSTLQQLYPTISTLSIHALSGMLWLQVVLFTVAAAFALALAIGYRTRLATIGSLILLISLHARNPVVLNAGDAILRRLLVWSVFLPLGTRWSLDSVRSEFTTRESTHGTIATVATAALLLQITTIYTVNFLFKLRSDVWLSGKAVQYALALDLFTTGFGDPLATVPVFPYLANWAWLGLLAASPLLVLATGRIRIALVSLFAAMHLGMFLAMPLGIFPLVSIVALVPFLPAGAWNRVESLATGIVAGTGIPVRPQPSPSATDGGRRQRERNRRVRNRATSVLVVTLVILAATWNLATLGVVALPSESGGVSPDAQRWDMFAQPPTTDAWYVAPATLDSGTQVDALDGGPVSWTKPPDVSASYRTDRWQKYLVTLWLEQPPGLDSDLGAYLCRQASAPQQRSVESVSIVIVEDPTRFADSDEHTRNRRGTYACS